MFDTKLAKVLRGVGNNKPMVLRNVKPSLTYHIYINDIARNIMIYTFPLFSHFFE